MVASFLFPSFRFLCILCTFFPRFLRPGPAQFSLQQSAEAPRHVSVFVHRLPLLRHHIGRADVGGDRSTVQDLVAPSQIRFAFPKWLDRDVELLREVGVLDTPNCHRVSGVIRPIITFDQRILAPLPILNGVTIQSRLVFPFSARYTFDTGA